MYFSARRRRNFFGVIFYIIDRSAKKVVFIPPLCFKIWWGKGGINTWISPDGGEVKNSPPRVSPMGGKLYPKKIRACGGQ